MQIGSDSDGDALYYSIPTSTAGIVDFLPGIHQILQGAERTANTATFYLAIEEGNVSRFQSVLTNQPAPVALSINDLSFVLASGDRDNFNADWEALRNTENRIFFVDDQNPFDFTNASQNQIVDGLVYEVVSYANTTGEIRFGALGEGDFFIGTDRIFTPGILGTTRSGTGLVTIDNTTGELTATGDEVNVVPTFQALNYAKGTDMGPIAGIEIQPSLATTIDDNTGTVTVNVTPTFQFGGLVNMDVTPASPFHFYNLDTITEQRTITLPSGTVGDTIRFFNVSTAMMEVEEPVLWRIVPASGQRIAGLLNEELILDLTMQSFDLVYSGLNEGWSIL